MILNEIQKAIIDLSSLRIKTEIGFIEIYKGGILNAEKTNGEYGLNALIDIIKNSINFQIEILEELPITTITEGWTDIRKLLFENEFMLFKNLKLSENEIMKLREWLKFFQFNGFLVNKEFFDVFLNGNLSYSKGLLKENIPFNAYEVSEKFIKILLKSVGNIIEEEISKISEIRKQFAIEGKSGIILSYERIEIFENGVRIFNLNENLPVDLNKFLFGFEGEEMKTTETPFLTDKDLKVLSYILENSLKLLSQKAGVEFVQKAIEKHKPDVNNPQSIIDCIKEVMDKAKFIGGTGWLKKNMDKISDGVKDIQNEELRKLLNELFKV